MIDLLSSKLFVLLYGIVVAKVTPILFRWGQNYIQGVSQVAQVAIGAFSEAARSSSSTIRDAEIKLFLAQQTLDYERKIEDLNQQIDTLQEKIEAVKKHYARVQVEPRLFMEQGSSHKITGKGATDLKQVINILQEAINKEALSQGIVKMGWNPQEAQEKVKEKIKGYSATDQKTIMDQLFFPQGLRV